MEVLENSIPGIFDRSIDTKSNVWFMTSRGINAQQLIQIHNRLLCKRSQNTKVDHSSLPILIHFHDFPVFILKVTIIEENIFSLEDNAVYLHKIQRFNNKICGE
jgi:hypothetical protein